MWKELGGEKNRNPHTRTVITIVICKSEGQHVGSKHHESYLFFIFFFLLIIFDSTTPSVNCRMKRDDSQEAR